MIGSAYLQPVVIMTSAEISTPTEPIRSASTSRYAPRTLMLSFAPSLSTRKLTTLASSPSVAAIITGQPGTAGGSWNRPTAS